MNNKDEIILEWGQSIERAMMRLLQNYGYRVFSQTKENFSPVDGVLQGKDLNPIQIKAITPRFTYRDMGIKKQQWKRYKKFGKDYSKFTLYCLCCTYNPIKDFDYRIYEFDINEQPDEPLVQDNEFYYIKLDKMKKSNIEVPIEFQKKIEEYHKKYIRPLLLPNFRNTCKDKF